MSADPATREVIGLIPAAGVAARIAPLPCSKELYPIGFRGEGAELRPKVVCHYLLERMRLAGISRAYIVLRSGKWDIPAYLGDGALVDMHLAYLMMGRPYGSPYSLDQAYPFVRHALVALGFPDILFEPADAYAQVLARQAATGADVALGALPTDHPHKADMLDLTADGRLRRIVIKPAQTELRDTWVIAVWTPAFTEFMHRYLAEAEPARAGGGRELFVGDVIQAALDAGMRVEVVRFPNGACLDIGTPEHLAEAVRRFAAQR